MSQTEVSGTREWAVHSVNCVSGCEHNCRYCYARYDAVVRFKRLTAEQWPTMWIRPKDVKAKRQKREGRIMFPTTHDITPCCVDACLTVLGKLLAVGNEVLIVSKPHIDVIVKLIDQLDMYRDKIMFRFTIGAHLDGVLRYWEPGAPTFGERLGALAYAHDRGWKTSVSIEPILDMVNVERLVDLVEPYVSDSIWLGKMNNLDRARSRVETEADKNMLDILEELQNDERIRDLHEDLKDEPKVRWKESIKKIVGIPLATEAGTDE